MRSGKRLSALAFLLLALCAGCARKRQPATPPPQAQAPSLPTPQQTAALMPPLPPLPAVSPRPVNLNTAVPPETERSRRRIFRHHAKPETAGNHAPEAAQPAPQPAPNPQVATGATSDVSPIGQLSTASGDGEPTDRAAIAGLIESTQKGLDAIKHPLSAREQKTAAQIRTFLAHARDAMKTNDLDGARTLAVKAHLLLEELTTQ
ncbi:MAG: hypothetical protein WCA44_11895 [Acidobacteriaceae bacterium]